MSPIGTFSYTNDNQLNTKSGLPNFRAYHYTKVRVFKKPNHKNQSLDEN